MMTYTKSNFRDMPTSQYSDLYKNLKIGKNYGRCVIAKKDFKAGEIIEVAPFITDNEFAYRDYVFYSSVPNSKYMLVLGYGSLYNHSDNPNVSHEVLDNSKNEMESSYMAYYANRDIKEGEELKITYGKSWWSGRGLVPQEGGTGRDKVKKYRLKRAKKYPTKKKLNIDFFTPTITSK